MPVSAQLIPDPAVEPTISVDRAATILGVGRRTLYFAIERDEFPVIRVGKRLRIPTARFLAEFSDLTSGVNATAGQVKDQKAVPAA
jgi:excisionase family DNA binding protein